MGEPLPETIYAIGFSWRKRRFVREFLQGSAVRFVREAGSLPTGAPLAVWGCDSVPPEESSKRLVLRLEDGFLRSVGLGAALSRPLSWVIDRRGIYYDSSRPSEIEHLLQETEFSPELLHRAGRLREAIVESGVTKYNVDIEAWRRPSGLPKVILVPGQVENDASLRYGAPGIRTNIGLLKAVRLANPEAYIVYKPHPDVVAGLRKGGEGEEKAAAWCDEQLTHAAMGQLLLEVDEVHVLTSLAGFEALLRGRAVTCHGQPFYAGWGLTTDLMPIPRRTRKLSMDALIAGALILYPTYISRLKGCITTPEGVIEELRQWRTASGHQKPGRVRSCACMLFHGFLRQLEEFSRRKAETRR